MRNLLASSRVIWSGVLAAAVVLGQGPSAQSETTRSDTTEKASVLLAALSAAVTTPGARVDIVAVDLPSSSSNCVTSGPDARVETSRPIDGSGRVAVKLTGARPGGAACEVWAWARVRIFAKVPVTRRALRAGEALAMAAATEVREIKSGHTPAAWETVVAGGSVADRSLGAGQMIEADAVRAPGLKSGETVKVVIVSGALAIEQTGHAIPCVRGRICALLPSGKHVEGTLVDGRLMVQMP